MQRRCLGRPDPEGPDVGALAEADLDLACTRVVDLVLRVAAERAARADVARWTSDAHHALARRAARRHRPAHQRRPAPARAQGGSH